MLPGTTYAPEDILRIVWNRKLLIAACVVVGTGVGVAVARGLPNAFRSEALIMVVPQRIPENYVKATVTEKVEDRLSALSERTLSRSRLEQTIADFDLYRNRGDQTNEEILARMRKDVKIAFNKNESFTIGYTSDDAAKAQKVTERLASLFIQENAQDRESQAENTNQFLESQLDDAKRRLMDHEKKLEDYRRRYSGQLPAQAASNLQIIQSAETQRQSVADAINRARERRILVERQLVDLQSPDPGMRAATGSALEPGAVAPSLGQQLLTARTALDVLKASKTAEHPDVRAGERRVRELEAKLRAEPGTRPADEALAITTPGEALRQRRVRDLTIQMADIDRELQEKADDDARLRGVIGDYQGRLNAMPTRESELVDLTRDYATLQDLYRSLLTKREESKISADLERQSAGEQFRILEPPLLPLQPFRPNRLLISLGGLAAGLLLGIALTGVLEYLESGFRSEEEIARLLSVPVLAAIPVMTGGRPGATAGSGWRTRSH